MKLIICVGERGEMVFNKRRVSRDKLVVSDIAEYVGDATLFMEPYSEELFSEAELNIILSENALRFAEDGDFIFLERQDPLPYAEAANELIIYNWNRRYPFDLAMKFSPKGLGFKLESVYEFKANAHDKVTRKVYKK